MRQSLQPYKPLFSPVFIVCCCLFVAHQLVEKQFEIRFAFADNYLDNLLAIPILLTLLLVERRTLFRRGTNYRMTAAETMVATLFIAAVGEWLFPLLSDDFTFDWMDFFWYGVGAVLFHISINKRQAADDAPKDPENRRTASQD